MICKAEVGFWASGMSGLMARQAVAALTARKVDSRGWLELFPVSPQCDGHSIRGPFASRTTSAIALGWDCERAALARLPLLLW